MVRIAMNRYLLDTTACIALIRHNEKVINTILKVGQENCFVSEITLAELYYGACKSQRASHLQDIQLIKETFEIVPLFSSLHTYGEIKADLERKGKRIDEFDLLIGATALFNAMILVTHNTKHLARIPLLTVEDWEL